MFQYSFLNFKNIKMIMIKISSREEAVQLRIFYNKESLKSLNWFGVGPGNFVNWLMVKDPNLPRSLYQPVHNIYLLIYSETGIWGIVIYLVSHLFGKRFYCEYKNGKAIPLLFFNHVLIFFICRVI